MKRRGEGFYQVTLDLTILQRLWGATAKTKKTLFQKLSGTKKLSALMQAFRMVSALLFVDQAPKQPCDQNQHLVTM